MKKYERLKILRENLHLTQAFVAKQLKMNRSSFNKLENGGRDLKAEELEQLSKIYGVTSDYILNGDKEIKKADFFQRSFESLSENDQEEIVNAIRFKLRLKKKLDSRK